MNQPTKSVGIWIRVSTEDQAQGESPVHHEKRGRYYAESRGWRVVEVYHLEGVSGKSVMQHPETQRMLKDIKSHRITGLIFSKLARLARNTKELLEFSDLFRQSEADLISLQEAIDTSTPAGRLFYTMIAAMAEWEREEIGSRVAASIPIRAKLGKRIGAPAPFGYQWVDNKVVPHPEEAPVRKLMYELFLECRRIRTVAAELNKRGYRPREGKRWYPLTVRRLLEDPTAKGVRRANYTTNRTGTKTTKPKEDWVLTPVEPIVSEATWEEVNKTLQDRKAAYRPPPTKRAAHLFSGLLFCHCGTKMYVKSNTPKYVCPDCKNKVSIDDMEAVFHEQLRSFVFSEEEVGKYLVSANQVLTEKSELLEALLRERDKVTKDMAKILRLYKEDQISPEGFGSEYKPLEQRIKQIDEQIPELQAKVDFLKINAQSSDEIVSEARDLHSRWPTLTFESKRQIVESITEKVTVGQGDISIDLYYLPSAASRLLDESSSDSSKTVAKGRRTHSRGCRRSSRTSTSPLRGPRGSRLPRTT